MDFDTIATSVLGQATTALTAAIPVIVLILGATIGFKVLSRFTKKG